jgi:hypothetical protein
LEHLKHRRTAAKSGKNKFFSDKHAQEKRLQKTRENSIYNSFLFIVIIKIK